jgi:predicted negative regulator of RcsB-dependent stress response
MPTARSKFRRKDLKQPDEFFTFLADAEEFVAGHLREVMIALALVLVVIAAAFAIRAYQQHRASLASARFYKAFSALTSKQYDAARNEFINLATDEPRREVGRLARFYLAKCYLAQGDLPRARDALVAYLPDAHELTFRALALMDLGIIYERMGDPAKAEGVYRQAAALPGPVGMDAELARARILEKQNKTVAIATYQRFLQEHPYSPQRQRVVESLARLGAAPETIPPAASR